MSAATPRIRLPSSAGYREPGRAHAVRAAQCVEQAWRNGGGSTLEIARAEGETPWWRLSRARIGADGPFSDFPARHRLQLLCRGEGIQLDFDDGSHRRVLPNAGAIDYPGAPGPRCRLLDGPVEVLNLLWDPARLRARLCRDRLVDGQVRELGGDGIHGVHVLSGRVEAVDGAGSPLAAGDSLLLGPGSGTQRLRGAAELALVHLVPA